MCGNDQRKYEAAINISTYVVGSNINMRWDGAQDADTNYITTPGAVALQAHPFPLPSLADCPLQPCVPFPTPVLLLPVLWHYGSTLRLRRLTNVLLLIPATNYYYVSVHLMHLKNKLIARGCPSQLAAGGMRP